MSLSEFSISEYNKFYQMESDYPFFNPDSINCEYDNPKINPIKQDHDIEIEFNDINKVMNLEPLLDENEYLSNNELYFIKSEIKKEDDNSFLSKKRNINSIIEEKQEFEKEFKSNLEQTKKETKESTNCISPKFKKKLFESKSKIYRNDYYIKKFKVECFSNYLTDKLNKLLKVCSFPKHLNLSKIYMPNNKAFTSIANLKINQTFLPKKIKDIFSLGNGKGKNQIKNASIFSKIFNSEQYAKNFQAYEELINWLDMTMENSIKEYYNSEEFKNFERDEEIIKYDEAFKKEKKFSLLNDFGFLKLIKNQY